MIIVCFLGCLFEIIVVVLASVMDATLVYAYVFRLDIDVVPMARCNMWNLLSRLFLYCSILRKFSLFFWRMLMMWMCSRFLFVFWKVQLKGTDHAAALDLLRLFAYGTWSDYRSKDSGPQLLTLRNLEFITWGGI